MSQTVLEAALQATKRGWHVFPLRAGQKTPYNGFKWGQDAFTAKAKVSKYFDGSKLNYAVSCGPSNLVVIDEDAPGDFQRWQEDTGLDMPPTFQVRTPSGGTHYFFRRAHDQGLTKIGNPNTFKDDGYDIDVRGQGGYVVGPGSYYVPSPEELKEGKKKEGPYTVANDVPVADLPEVLEAYLTREEETRKVREAQAKTAPVSSPIPSSSRPSTLKPGDMFNQEHNTPEALADYLAQFGWQEHHRSGSEIHMTRPGKSVSAGPSATVKMHNGRPGLYVFSTSTDFTPETPYTPFGAYTRLEHGGDHKAAARALAQRYGAHMDFGVTYDLEVITGHASTAQDAEDGQDAFTREVALEVAKLKVREAARQQVNAEKLADLPIPTPTRLDVFLEQPDEPTPYLIQGLHPQGGRVVLAAQAKTGKTTLVGNTTRALVDGEPFLDRFEVAPVQRILIIDNELHPNMLRRWLRDQGIENTRKVELIPLRGNLSAFNILDPATRTKWAKTLGAADLVIFDCLRPAMDALGLDENHDAGRFLEAFDELTTEAHITNTLIVHHMGHAGERSRGDSRIIDWPDANWKLTREGQDDEDLAEFQPRYLSANGRDVDLPQTVLQFDQITRRLTALEGTKKQIRARENMLLVLGELAAGEALTKKELEDRLAADTRLTRGEVRTAVKDAQKAGYLSVSKGNGNSHIHTITWAGQQFAETPRYADPSPRIGKVDTPVRHTLKGGESANQTVGPTNQAGKKTQSKGESLHYEDALDWDDCTACNMPIRVEALEGGLCKKCVSKQGKVA